jgi:hypothetical protein
MPGLLTGEDGVTRCWWACSAAEYRAYHDTEWGFPVSDDVRLFENRCPWMRGRPAVTLDVRHASDFLA